MTNPNRPHQTPTNDDAFNRSVNGRPVTNDEMAYRDGYVHGKTTEQRVEAVRRAERDESASRGLLIGLALASLVGIIAGTLYYLNREPDTVAPSPAPVVLPQGNTEPNRETTIIERTREVVVPPANNGTTNQAPAPNVNVNVPEQPAPNVNVDVPQQPAPNVNVTVPETTNTAPATTEAPRQQPNTTQPVSPEANTEAAPTQETSPGVDNTQTAPSTVN
ncbi:hypothetical protein H6G20_19570 [Desertifilum sp. FACHB-1129]|uniref:Uncharacterized protein n=1 Tax=Desertifilum tharense IPPAS B-1220 TaxID=1781255 RepID=A0A1E5QRD9_9CYAN|nr:MULTISPECIES: hypothetical protein [Desertifilum]MDA0212450.1 hypothetical protein [Cyanobacteria bacterium FC1]MBD2313872.1 hypothetical protein [Desertifilum sp. FACHB-1129]MBD2323221.1 hypothetical protein [Desertifilum sp. FACHB-866]MBD2333066.1 hypothetical protein [Desertifilum sp. FACHB-868]OEJ76903.1 hypothetical protein BH720_01535 [Desertifilum tharense IPPAS B-1220]